MNERTENCGVCRDLLPLVRDGVACEESEAWVRAHLAGCESCRAAWEAEPQPEREALPNDKKVLRRVERRMSLWMLCYVFFGLTAGMLLARSSQHGSYTILLFPLLCGVAYWVDGLAWKLLPPLAAAVWFLEPLLRLDGVFGWVAFAGALLGCALPAALCYLGAGVSALLKYACNKQKKE